MTPALFLLAVLCVAAMGYAIQRGATCTVLAVDEILAKGRATRLLAMLEASAWVGGGLALASVFGWGAQPPPGYAPGLATVAGGVLLGLGAFVNRSCVFGAVAKLGSGQWAYAFTPLGFLAGCWLFQAAGAMAGPPRPTVSPVLTFAPWAAAGFGALVAWRLSGPLRRLRRAGPTAGARALVRALGEDLWRPHTATTVIGVTFLILLLTSGPWAYTDLLADLADGAASDLARRLALFAALLGGSMLGGWRAGRLKSARITAGGATRCFTGGAIMAVGSLLIPGSNDGLILVGLPLLWPYAWLAFCVMCVTIATARLVAGTAPRKPRPAS
jgi:hypothetical protein